MDTNTPFPALISPSVLALPLALFAACGQPGARSKHIPSTEPFVAASATASAQLQVREAVLLPQAQPRAQVQPEPEPELQPPAPEPSPRWSLVHTASAALAFAPLSRGVLLHVGDERLTLDEDGALIAAPKRANTKHAIVGSWPDDAWAVGMRSEERAGLLLRMSKWKSNRRWVPQPVKDMPDYVWGDEDKWYEISADFWAEPGGRGGYLLAMHDYDNELLSFRRMAGENFAPVDLPWPEDDMGWPRGVYEAPSGRVLVFFEGEGNELELLERARCRTHCALERAELPEALGDQYLSQYVARGEDAVSIGVRPSWDDAPAKQLLSRDASGWVIEDAPISGGEFRDLAAGADEGLFVVIGVGTREQLWHRDRAGAWTLVELPEPFNAKLGVEAAAPLDLQVTTLDDASVWVAINGSDSHLVYALPSTLG